MTDNNEERRRFVTVGDDFKLPKRVTDQPPQPEGGEGINIQIGTTPPSADFRGIAVVRHPRV